MTSAHATKRATEIIVCESKDVRPLIRFIRRIRMREEFSKPCCSSGVSDTVLIGAIQVPAAICLLLVLDGRIRARTDLLLAWKTARRGTLAVLTWLSAELPRSSSDPVRVV